MVFQPKICNIYVVEKGKICGRKSKICDLAKDSKSLIQQRKIVLVGLKAQRCHFTCYISYNKMTINKCTSIMHVTMTFKNNKCKMKRTVIDSI